MLLLVLVEDSKDEAAIQGEGLASLRICLPEIKQKGTSPLLKAVSIFFAKLMSSGEKLNLGFGNDFDGEREVLELSFFAPGIACMTEMPSPHLFPQLVLGTEVPVVAEILIQRLIGLGRAVLRDGPLSGNLSMAESPGKRGLDVLSRRRRREGAFEEPPRSGPRRRRRHAGRQRTGSSPWGGTSVRIRTRPGTGRSGGSRRRVLYRNGVVDGGGRERTLSLRRLIGESGNSGCSISITGGGDRLTITLAHHSSSERTAN
nr:hypothetical protein Iba_scaffold19384CG0010 [Ipomoea batatas]